MSFQKRPLALFAALILLKINGLAQLKSPNDFLPHQIGDQFTPHFMLVDYFEEVARQSPTTVKLTRFGATHEGRPQLLAVISSAENMARIEQIRLAHLATTEGKKTASGEANMAVVWLGYSVHGNEAAGSEASMKLLFDLARQTKPEIREWLKNTVVLIDPSQNPDGYDRYSSWNRMTSNRILQADPASREHVEPWPGGRPNHYYFDLNRDWAWQTQPESRNRTRAYFEWMPHIHADIHEQYFDNPYYFAPAAEPFHEVITPFQRDFQVEIGKNHARHFDKNGWLYFTREQFDLLYPSYGDTWPTYNGSIGMTYEQGGIRAGRGILTEIGDTLSLHDRVAHHYESSISTVEIASKNAVRLVDNFRKYFDDARQNPRGQWKSFVLKAADGRLQQLQKLTQLLDNHQIAFGQAGRSSSQNGFNFETGAEESFTVNADDIVVSCFQKHGDMALALLEPQTKLVDSITYDITAWSLPLAYGLDAFALKTRLEPAEKRAICSFAPIAPTARAYGYVVRWQDQTSSRFLSECLKKDLRVRRSGGPFEVDGQSFAAGSLVLTRADNADFGADFDEIVSKSGMAAQTDVFAATTGFVARGQDFGSDGMRLVTRPQVALVYSDDCDENGFGHIWWHFEHELEYPLTTLPLRKVESGSLEHYTHLILPEGISIEKMDGLKAWIQRGGQVIAVGDAVKIFADKDGFDLKTRVAAEEKKDDKKPPVEPKPQGNQGRDGLSDAVYGAIIKNRLDATNPLAFGLGDHYFSLKTNSNSFEFLKNGTVAWVPEDYLSYGFIGSRLRPKLKSTATVGRQTMGKGSVTYLVDPPLFRCFWEQGKLLFDNALFF